MTSEIADGMVTLWTVECPAIVDGIEGVHIDDLKDTQEEAAAEVERRGAPWTSVKVHVPYSDPK